ncbi:MAG: hypothetical protein ABH813_02795 [Patescibacteria group bacterium]
MKIIRNKESAISIFTLVPVETDEEQSIAFIATSLKPEDKLSYSYKKRDGGDDKFYIAYFLAGGHEGEKEVVCGSVIMHCKVPHVDGVEFILRGATKEDKYEVNSISDMCFHGSGGLIFLGETEVDGKISIIVTGKRCKYCRAGIHYSACKRDTCCERDVCDDTCVCNACVAKCEYGCILGPIHGRGTDVGELRFQQQQM